MPRRARLKIAGFPLHVIQRGVNRSACFVTDNDRGLYLAMLKEVSGLFSCSIHAYVLMPNHVHLLLTAGNVDGASLLMKHLGQRYVQAFNRRHSRTGTLWEGRFRSCVVDSEAYLFRCHQYIEMNPVRAGMVLSPRDYAWSSYRANAEGAHSSIVTPHALYRSLGVDAQDRSARYCDLFHQELSDEELRQIRSAANGGSPLGLRFIGSTGDRPRNSA